jgi:hypothetical protein
MDDAKWIAVNLNQTVRVTLTEQGRQTLIAYHSRHSPDNSLRVTKLVTTFETQLWVLMGIFGSVLQTPGVGGPFENNRIEIQEGIW